MLTVKFVDIDGTELIQEARCVQFNPERESRNPHGSALPSIEGREVIVTRVDNNVFSVVVGTVYVMNDTGRTVSKYDLSQLARAQEARMANQAFATCTVGGKTFVGGEEVQPTL